jgi:hypothetical protein
MSFLCLLRGICFLAASFSIFGSVLLSQDFAPNYQEGSEPLDIGTHQTADTDWGRFSVGVSRIEVDEESARSLGRLEVGYVFEWETNHFIPRTIEMTPFYLTRFEASTSELDLRVGDGVGWRATLGKKGGQLRWILQVTALFPEYRYANSNDRETELEVMLGIRKPLPGGPRTGILDRIRQLDLNSSEFVFKLPLSLVEDAESDELLAENLRMSMMTAHFLRWLDTRQALYKLYRRSETKDIWTLDLVGLIFALGNAGDRLSIHRWRESLDYSFEDARDLVERSLGDHLLQVLRSDLRLFVSLESDDGRICEQAILPKSGSFHSCSPLVFNSDLAFSEFVDAMGALLYLQLSDPRRYAH